MGACISSNNNLKDELANLKAENAKLNNLKAQFLLKARGEYWDTFHSVWDFERTEYNGSFRTALSHREKTPCVVYTADKVQVILTNGHDLKAVPNGETPSIFEIDSAFSRVSHDSGAQSSNRAEDKSHDKKVHAKTILGFSTVVSWYSRTHTIPADKECNVWWWPVFRLVTGYTSLEYNPEAISKLANMRTSKFVFSRNIAYFYDTLKAGILCPIPIFDSLKDMAAWQERDGYKMLIVADSADTYVQIGMSSDDAYPHIRMATRTEVETATTLLAEMMKVMADSLVSNWDCHYSSRGEGDPQKDMLKRMKEFMEQTGTIHIPKLKRKDGQDPKLYILDYDLLYKDEEQGKKYILDPYPALIKTCVNLSYFLTDTLEDCKDIKGCKFLPCCGGSNSDSSEEEQSFLFHVRDSQQTSLTELIGKDIELRYANEDEYDDDDISQ